MSIATETPKRRALGKGLESLLPRVQATVADPAETPKPPATETAGKPHEIPVGEIVRMRDSESALRSELEGSQADAAAAEGGRA